MRLTDLVLERRFNYLSASHRRALLDGALELPDDDPRREKLVEAQANYRMAAGLNDGAYSAYWFGRHANDDPDDDRGVYAQ